VGDPRYQRSDCENCGASAQHIDMGTNPEHQRVCGFCLRLYPHHADFGARRRADKCPADDGCCDGDGAFVLCESCPRRMLAEGSA
jgi:hypothetical protein